MRKILPVSLRSIVRVSVIGCAFVTLGQLQLPTPVKVGFIVLALACSGVAWYLAIRHAANTLYHR